MSSIPPKQDEVVDLTSDTEDKQPSHISLDDTDGRSEGEEDDDDDEDLRRAIELSLQDQAGMTSTSSLNPLDNSNDPSSAKSRISDLQRHQSLLASATASGTTSLSFLGLDRKQMEADRLARLKRKRETSLSEEHVPLNNSTTAVPMTIPAAQDGSSHSSSVASTEPRSTGRAAPRHQSLTSSFLQFPVGKICLTSSVARSASTTHMTSFSELVKPRDSGIVLRSVVLSTFTADFDWLLPHFDTKHVSFVLILHAANAVHKADLERDFAGVPNVRIVIPQINGVLHTMHSKLILLFYEESSFTASSSHTRGKCRIIVPTANLTPYDWGVGEVMENMVFIIDLPEKSHNGPSPVPPAKPAGTHFENDLKANLRSMNVPAAVLTRLERYDFSKTNDIRFVSSTGGMHVFPRSNPFVSNNQAPHTMNLSSKSEVKPAGVGAIRPGLLSLSDSIVSLGFDRDVNDPHDLIKIDYITSSLGALKPKFLSGLYISVCGQASRYLELLSGSSKTATDSNTLANIDRVSRQQLDIYFPSERTVHSSKGGPASAGTICFNSTAWKADARVPFPRQCLRDCVGIRGDQILMHTKILFVRFLHPERLCLNDSAYGSTDDSRNKNAQITTPTLYAGWVYVGSANLSESAWGAIVFDKKAKTSRITCRNWETGVVIPVPASIEVQKRLEENPGTSLHDLSLQEVFGQTIPVPIAEPAETYDDGRQPWFFNGYWMPSIPAKKIGKRKGR